MGKQRPIIENIIPAKASGRQAVLKEALVSVGGKLDSIYYALGEADVYVLCECPDHISAAALALAASSSGMIHTKTVPLMTVEETDRALGMKTAFRAPGASKAVKA
jgi:uncharacterized protein with GYD domain